MSKVKILLGLTIVRLKLFANSKALPECWDYSLSSGEGWGEVNKKGSRNCQEPLLQTMKGASAK